MERSPSRLRALLGWVIATTVALIGLGGFTTSKEAGMGCGEEWPLCNGKYLPDFGNALETIEWSHRGLAALVGLLLLAAVAVAWRQSRLRRYCGWALVLLVAQALLGASAVLSALTVKWLVVLHLGVSMAFLGVLVVWHAALGEAVPAAKPARLARLLAGATLVQMLLGAVHVHGSKSPHIMMTHIVVGVVVAGLAMALMAAARRAALPPGGLLPARWVGWLATAQVGLGFWLRETLARPNYPGVLVLHLALAAVVWALAVLVAARLGRGLAKETL